MRTQKNEKLFFCVFLGEMKNRVKDYIIKNNMIQKGDRVVLGLSGGADSVCLYLVLVELMEEMDFDILCVHINHGIRGKEAAEDEIFCERLCKSFGTRFLSESFDVPAIAKEKGLSEEEAGRIIRYDTFEKIRKSEKCTRIAVAHHMSDNAETMLFNLVRGSGLKGLGGMSPVRDKVIRPLLCVSRGDIEEYLGKIGQTYKTDSTNLENEYARNKIRNVIIPELEKINPLASEHINRSMEFLREINEYFEENTEKQLSECMRINEDDEVCLDIDMVTQMHQFMKKNVLKAALDKACGQKKDIASVHIEALVSLLGGSNGSMVNLPYDVTAYREYEVIRFSKKKENIRHKTRALIKGITAGEKLSPRFDGKNYLIEIVENPVMEEIIKENPYTKYVDCDKITGSLEIRYPKAGDYISVGEGREKKLSRFFIDEKVPKAKRDETVVFADGSRIIWVVGKRLGSFYKVSKNTEKVLKISVLEEENE